MESKVNKPNYYRFHHYIPGKTIYLSKYIWLHLNSQPTIQFFIDQIVVT